jgi:hypothetical protein
MSRLIAKLTALFAPLILALVAQPAAAQVFAKVSDQAAQSQVIALLAVGPESAKQVLEGAAKAKGYRNGRAKNSKGEDEVMVMVPDTGDHDQFWAFYDEVRGGRYGAFVLDIIVLPLDTDTSQKDYLDKARVWGSSYVSQPAPAKAILGRSRGMKRDAVVLGIIGTGKDAEMAKLEAAGKAAGYITAPSKGSKGEPDMMVIVRRSDDPAKFWNFYRQAVRGQHGKQQIELILIPQQYDPAASDYLDHAKVFHSSQIIEP